MFKLTSLNLNGIRSASSKGLHDWLAAEQPDCICVQELKAQVPDLLGRFEHIAGLHGYFHCAEKKGYSGVGIYTRHPPSDVRQGFGPPEFDAEGRYLELRFDTPTRRLSLISAYFPSGSSGPERQEAKFRFLAAMRPHLQQLRAEREFILCGDINIAHQEKDLKNWRGNQKNSGFLPHERAWLDTRYDVDGWIDAFREVNQEEDQYTWWSNRGQAWAKNVGWRIDYQMVTPDLRGKALAASIWKDSRFSDHAPLIMDYAIDLPG